MNDATLLARETHCTLHNAQCTITSCLIQMDWGFGSDKAPRIRIAIRVVIHFDLDV